MINYRRISENVNITDIAERYGVTINGHNKSICPFHSEKTASLSYHNNRFKCFGCGASGDSVDFVSRLLNLSLAEASARICADFGLITGQTTKSEASIYVVRQRRLKAFREYELKLFIALCDERHRMSDILRAYHGGPEDEPPMEITDVLGKISITDHYINALIFMPEDKKIEWLSENREGVENVAGRFFR